MDIDKMIKEILDERILNDGLDASGWKKYNDGLRKSIQVIKECQTLWGGMSELDQQIWDLVNGWCDEQHDSIPDQNRRYLMDKIQELIEQLNTGTGDNRTEKQ